MKNSYLFLFIVLVAISTVSFAQVGIGTSSPNADAVLELSSTSQGMKFPKMTSIERMAIVSPAKGLCVFDTDINCLMVNFGTTTLPNWRCIGGLPFSTSTNGTGVVTSYTATISGGTLLANAVSSGVTQTISAFVTKAGTYSISTTNNGVTYSGSGTFASVGPQELVLTATGTPTSTGTHTFSINTSPSCSFSATTIVFPATFSLIALSNTYINSVYDVDYLPYSPPTTVASLNSLAADGVNETTTVNIQGSIPTTGKTINIVVATTASVTLPAYVSPIISIPAEYTEDNISRDIKLSWDAQILSSTSRFITAKIVAIGGTLNLKKLDINAGNGNNNLGILAGTLSYIRNNANELGSLHLRIMPGIPDKMFGIADNTGSTTSHLLLYLPIETETGETWLNNNLGAYYAKIGHASFNPNQQATSYSDHLAYGSLFQWGRKADGHELINYSSGTSGVPVTNTTTSTQSDIPTHASFIRSYSDWRVTPNDDLWAFESSTNNPCPVGFKVPGETALQNLTSYSNYVQGSEEFIHIAKLTKPGVKQYDGTGNVVNAGTGNFGYYSSSTVSGSGVKIINLYNGSIRDRASANSVRCIKN
jgi:hypothetical protein